MIDFGEDQTSVAIMSKDGNYTPEFVTGLVNSMKNDIEKLKESVSDLVTENCEMKTEIGILRERLILAEGLIIQSQTKILQQADQITDLRCRSMRENIVVHGIPEDQNETWQKSNEKIKSFLKDDLKIDDPDDLKIDRNLFRGCNERL